MIKAENTDPTFNKLLDFLQKSRGFDFSSYKRSSLIRRVQKRMTLVEVQTYSDYLDFLQVYPQEFETLFNTILINVTHFFRDLDSWTYLNDNLLPLVIDTASSDAPIRVWSAGCSSGQEAYSIAILLTELLGVEAYRRRVKIYATDADEEALALARKASYEARELEYVTPEWIDRYFEQSGNQFIFQSDLRRNIIFGCHNLLEDAPISQLDLLVCRNTLMYFVAEAQLTVLKRFHFALRETGVMFLGKAEMLLSHTSLFTPISLPYRIFRPTPIQRHLQREGFLTQSHETGNLIATQINLQNLSFDTLPVAHLILDLDRHLVMINALCRKMFGVKPSQIGSPLKDLELSYRPVELRACVQQVIKEKKLLSIESVKFPQVSGNPIFLDIQINPLLDNSHQLSGVSISFINVTRSQLLQQDLQHANQSLETANEELQSSNEEMETTNEELQSTNEELETTNEELQSTNEELETINAELQSTNEELETTNEELRMRTAELDQTLGFLNSFMKSLDIGVIVIDPQFQLLSWNEHSQELWGLRGEEVIGKSVWSLDIGLPLEQLRVPIGQCLKTGQPSKAKIEAVNRRGKQITCYVKADPLKGLDGVINGVIILVS